MSQKPIHILHLTRYWLRWATLTRKRRALVLLDSGQIKGEAIAGLESWQVRPEYRPGSVYLYDARPMYYQFRINLPRKAGGRLDQAVKFKILKELGVGAEDVCWTTWPDEERADAEQNHYCAIVARKQAMQDLLDWKQRAQLNELWVGSDVSAIAALVQAAGRPVDEEAPPLLVFNGNDSGAMLYFVEAHGAISKAWIKPTGDQDETWWAGLAGSQWCLVPFGASAIEPYRQVCPTLTRLAQGSPARLGIQPGNKPFAQFDASFLDFDAIILGAIRQLESGFPLMPSLLPRDGTSSVLGRLEHPSLHSRIGLLLAFLLLLLLGLLLWNGHRGRARAGEELSGRTRRLGPVNSLMRAQLDVLARIKKDRAASASTLLEALHKAAPAGVRLQSLTSDASGAVSLEGIAPDSDAASAFYQGLAKSPLFDPASVQLQEVKKIDAKRVSFSIYLNAKRKNRP